MDSPYHPGFGARPAVLVGRDAHLARIEAVLTRVQNSGDAAPAHVVFTGARGYGKTVILSVAAERATARGFVVAQVALDAVSNGAQMLAAAVAEAVAPLHRSRAGGAWRAVKQRLSALSIEVNAGVVKIASGPAAAAGPAIVTVQRQVLAGILSGAAQAARDKDRAGLLIVLDEMQEAPTDGMVVLANAIQDAAKTPNSPLAVIGAGLPNTPERIMAAASFTERFNFRTLGRLDEPDAARALLEPALAVGVRWTPAAAELALAAADGSPYLIQYIGDETWTQAAPRARSTIEPDETRRALADVRDNLEGGMFRGRWNKATPAEQAVILAIAAVSGDGTATTADVSATLGAKSAQWSMARQALIDKGIIEPAGHGRMRFTMPGFGTFALARSGLDSQEQPSRPDS